MTKTALLYEKRVGRQENFLADAERLADLEGLENLTSKTEAFIQILNEGKLAQYKLLMLHKSDIEVNVIENICKDKHIALVLFSGGITSTLYSDSLGFPYLKINSKLFYNDENLFYFLDDFFNNPTEVNLLKLAYGEKWKLSAWLAFKQRIKFLKNKSRNWDAIYSMSDLYEHIGLNFLTKSALTSVYFPENTAELLPENVISFLEKWEKELTILIHQDLR